MRLPRPRRAASGPGWISEEPRSKQDEVNRRIYSSSRLVRQYTGRDLQPAEVAIFERFAADFKAARVLELGCGAGRITQHLIGLGADVVGVDVSPAMIAHCERTLPSATFLVADMRDLSKFGDSGFDVVVAGANVLDALSHDDRSAVLATVRRVLRSGGLLYLSSHNRNSSVALAEARSGPKLRLTANPYSQGRALIRYLRGRHNHARLGGLQVFGAEFAILNDSAHEWRLLHYYIDRTAQARQLAVAGFELEETFGRSGDSLPSAADDTPFTELHYVARAR